MKLKLFRSKEKKTGVSKIRIRQVRSGIACPVEMRETLKALGLGRINRVSERVDTPSIRGMIAKIPHLVEVVTE